MLATIFANDRMEIDIVIFEHQLFLEVGHINPSAVLANFVATFTSEKFDKLLIHTHLLLGNL